MCAGPMIAPTAANSLTSPAPVPPITCPGSISTRPSTKPNSDAPMVRPLMPDAANATPLAARSTVSGLGTRRVHTSIAAPAPAPAATVAITIMSEGSANAAPEQVVDCLADRGDARHREHRDQRGEEPVFHQVLPLVSKDQASDRHLRQCHEPHLSKNEGRSRLRPRDPSATPAYAAGVTSFAAICSKIVFTLVPVSVMAATATSAMSATSSAYSSKSCPSSPRTRFRKRLMNSIVSSSCAPFEPAHVERNGPCDTGALKCPWGKRDLPCDSCSAKRSCPRERWPSC